MAIFGPRQAFGSERGFYRYAQRHLRAAFSRLPTRTQCNRQLRRHQPALVLRVLHLVQLLAVSPVGVITGFGFGPARTKDQLAAETFFALRRCPQPQWCGAGAPAQGPYVVDKGFAGAPDHTTWYQHYGQA